MASKKESLLEWVIDQIIKQLRLKKDDHLLYKVEEVMTASRLQNKDDLKPVLLNKKPAEKGWHFVFALPPDITPEDFEKRRKAFETFTNCIVEFKNNGPVLIMSVYKDEFSDKIPFQFDPKPHLNKGMLAPIPIGITPAGKLIVIDLVTLPHMLIGGMTNYGKSVALRGIATSLILAGVQVYIIDHKRVTFSKMSPWIRLAKNDIEGERILSEVINEGYRRLDIIDESGCEKIQELNRKDLPCIAVIVDELTMIASKKSQKYIDDLVHIFRAAGISLILATQRPSAQVWDSFTETRAMLAGRLCFYVSDSTDSQMVLGKGNTRGASLPMVPGRAIWHGDNEQDILLQTMLLDKDTSYQLLQGVPKEVRENEQLSTLLIPG